ncbi:hypothetical protein [Paraburkholderia youngii]|uniref:hypothetical protein n=1 Tax=Paraburkholderia youngii TaxID=2782701 RepID=UPI003D1999A2
MMFDAAAGDSIDCDRCKTTASRTGNAFGSGRAIASPCGASMRSERANARARGGGSAAVRAALAIDIRDSVASDARDRAEVPLDAFDVPDTPGVFDAAVVRDASSALDT